MIRVVCTALFIIISLNTLALETDGVHPEKDSIRTNYFYVGISPLIYNKLKLDNEGLNHTFSKPLLTGEFNFGYSNYTRSLWSWGIDFSVGIIPFSIGYDFQAPDSSVFQMN